MVEDKRESNEARSGNVEFAAGDAGTTKDLVTTRPEATFALNNLTISYSSAGTTEATVEIFDEAEGTTSGDVGSSIASYLVQAGDFKDLENRALDDFEDDVVVIVSGNDSAVHINGEGYLTTG